MGAALLFYCDGSIPNLINFDNNSESCKIDSKLPLGKLQSLMCRSNKKIDKQTKISKVM